MKSLRGETSESFFILVGIAFVLVLTVLWLQSNPDVTKFWESLEALMTLRP